MQYLHSMCFCFEIRYLTYRLLFQTIKIPFLKKVELARLLISLTQYIGHNQELWLTEHPGPQGQIFRRRVVSKGRVQGKGLDQSKTNTSEGNKSCQGQIKINPSPHKKLLWQRQGPNSMILLHKTNEKLFLKNSIERSELSCDSNWQAVNLSQVLEMFYFFLFKEDVHFSRITFCVNSVFLGDFFHSHFLKC